MKWWNELWLNESFATYMSHLCMGTAPGLEDLTESWTIFLAYKNWAFREDTLPSTHPISCQCENTEEAEENFDGITYAKGSSSLKQLVYLIGLDSFKEGIQNYFKKFEWGNTELKDFMNCLYEVYSKKDVAQKVNLEEWSSQFLTTSGLNELLPIVEYEDGKIKNFKVQQKLSTFGKNILRMHRLDIAMYDQNFNETLVKNILISPEEFTDVPEMVGLAEPHAIYLNANDHAYAKIQIDAKSLAAFKQGLFKVKNEVNRKMIWRSVWEIVRDVQVSAFDYLELVHNILPAEKDPDIIRTNLIYSRLACHNFLPEEAIGAQLEKLFNTTYKMLKTEEDANLKLVLMKHVVVLGAQIFLG